MKAQIWGNTWDWEETQINTARVVITLHTVVDKRQMKKLSTVVYIISDKI